MLGDQPRIGAILAVSAKLALIDGQPIHAAELIGASEEHHRRHDLPMTTSFRTDLDWIAKATRETLAAAEFDDAH